MKILTVFAAFLAAGAQAQLVTINNAALRYGPASSNGQFIGAVYKASDGFGSPAVVNVATGELIKFDSPAETSDAFAADNGEIIAEFGGYYRVNAAGNKFLKGNSFGSPSVTAYVGSTVVGALVSSNSKMRPAYWVNQDVTVMTGVLSRHNADGGAVYTANGVMIGGTLLFGDNRRGWVSPDLGATSVLMDSTAGFQNSVLSISKFGVLGSLIDTNGSAVGWAVWRASDGAILNMVNRFGGYDRISPYGITDAGLVLFSGTKNFIGSFGLYDMKASTFNMLDFGGNQPINAFMNAGGIITGTVKLQSGSTRGYTASAAPVPEPATLTALSLGALAMLRQRRKA